MQVQITILYHQVCVFDPTLEQPYNGWNATQTEQGFSWRRGSVSFRTDDTDIASTIVVDLGQEAPGMESASTVIRVPFDVPASGLVEVGSILSGAPFPIPSGSYALYFAHPTNLAEPFTLTFVRSEGVEACVLKESGTAKVRKSYDMQASAA